MDFGLSAPQVLLQSSVRDLLAQEVTLEKVRAIMDSEEGFDRDLHRQLGDQGITGLLIGEEHGGSGLGMLDAVVAAQELGRAATPVSFHSSCVMAPLLVQALGNESQQAAWLPGMATGETVVSVALGGAEARDGRLNGSVPFVPDALHADAFLLVAGDTVLLLPRSTEGIEIAPLRTVDDTRRVGELRLSDVAIGEEARLAGDNPAAAVGRVEQAGRIALSADALATAQEGLRIAVEYAKQREQFGRVIASFQAVKHLCAETIAAVDPVQSLLWYTAYAWDEALDDTDYLVPLLKAHATDTATQAATTCTQVFGGIGFTHECDMHIHFKRAGYDRQMLGGPTELRRQAAAIQYPL